jgi:hypothetical protein
MIARNTAACSQEGAVSTPKSTGESRRLAMLKRAGLFGADTNGAVIVRAISSADLQKAYKVVHDVFVEEGYILPRTCGMRVRVYEALPETATFVAKVGDAVVGVQSLVVDWQDLGLPSDESFGQEIRALRGPGRRLCEATGQSIAQAFRKSAVPTELMRCCYAHATATGCNELITTVSPGHVRFYSLLGFEQISPVRSYSAEVEDPVVVVRMNLDTIAARAAVAEEQQVGDDVFLKSYYLDDNPYQQRVKAWVADAAAAFRDPALVRELFVEGSSILAECGPSELRVIRQRWGPELFDQVVQEIGLLVASV